MRHAALFLALQMGLCIAIPILAQEGSPAARPASTVSTLDTAKYVLGPGDVISVKVVDAEEVGGASIRIDPNGQISLPMLGRMTVAGLTVIGFEEMLSGKLKVYVKEPSVSVGIVEFRSQPVFVMGEVGHPGVHQLEGRTSLIEILAKAGGLKAEAGSVVKITRKSDAGMIPLPSAVKDPTEQFSVAEVSIAGILRATRPEENILILPNDVITVPRADLVYVLGEVRRPGGFTMNERRSVSALQALAMAEGFTPVAVPQNALLIRPGADGKRVEITVNLRDMLNGKKSDVELLPDDILLVPSSAARSGLRSAASTAISAITSAVIYAGLF